ncbi:MAG TPA: hypothetical protein VFJ02_07400 [Vicinamibacterales bacterium]|nr:hypothetical protein [Vicinamibacterales bacterium]
MKLRRATVAGMTAVLVLSTAGEAMGCGDKFLRPGRSTRQARYAAAYPASILIVKNARSSSSGLKDWQKMLKKAGHESVIVDGAPGVSRALAGQPYDLVIADYDEAAGLGAALAATPAKPGLLPVLDKTSQSLEAKARAEYHSVINPAAMTPFQALQEIDQLMELRSKRLASANLR